MVERIRMLLETRRLTPTQFADAIGIARPIVSHILSGRNKPSLEVVQRILAAMPDLSMPWLLNGAGPMLAVTAPSPPSLKSTLASVAPQATPPATPQPGIAPADVLATKTPRSTTQQTASRPVAGAGALKSGPKRFAVRPLQVASTQALGLEPSTPGPVLPPPASILPPAQALPPVAEPGTPSQRNSSPTLTAEGHPAAPAAAALLSGIEKPIRRIVIFYRDGSFADYQPE
ncbi:MAG: hypothetical protein JWR44_1447 [Hymenobacter sp.]|nr:hypothetical protein [Hymenobacter sp.]